MNGTFYVVNVEDKGFIKDFNNETTKDVFKAAWLKTEEYATKIAFDFNKAKPSTFFKIVELTIDSDADYFTFEDKNDINSRYDVAVENYEEDF